MAESNWQIQRGEGPLIATANHSGHILRPELVAICAVDDTTRLREEDPFTDTWTTVAPNRVVPLHSRFEVDLNRVRAEAVYLQPEDSWGLKIWREQPTMAMIERSLYYYDSFYLEMKQILTDMQRRYQRFVVFDLHSYNHRRDGPDAPAADQERNPDVNVGTGTMNRNYWATLVDRFIHDLRSFDYLGRKLDVRENVKFVGRQFPNWVHQTFPETGCALALEFKKFFMDEWTGKADPAQLEAIRQALRSTIPGIMEELAKL